MTKQRRWLVWFSVAWGVVLVVGALYAVFNGKATVKEQRTITQAQPVVDRATETVVTAAGPVAVRIGGYDQRETCRVTVARAGLSFQRVISLYTAPGEEKALLKGLADRLPKDYRASLVGESLYADAGEFIRVTGNIAGPGQVRVLASTGCRPAGDGPVRAKEQPDRAPVAAVFAVLGVEPLDWAAYHAGCVDTTVATTRSAVPGPLAAKFEGRELLIGTPELVVFRDGAASVVVTATAGSVSVSRTVTTCQ
ncbi:hypothetical protein R8Z50_01765 [Longispora sp. K20-0274]|uniref:hypothetical protein n=1 Tax=Longispora sp. K20-0274 TaxID=3088255 RepID=UPI00399AAF27